MLVFFEKVFDGFLSGTANVYTQTELSELLGSADHLDIAIQARGVAGTSPTLTIQLENSFDGTRWQNRTVNPEVNALSLNAGDNPLQVYADSSQIPTALGRLRFRIALGGTTPSGVFQIWASGRSPLVY